jgi:hypothetical protein
MINLNDDPRKGMKVPRGFFDQIEDEIMNEIKAKKVVPVWSRSSFRLTAIAASFLGVIAFTYIISIQNLDNQNSFSSISEELNWEYLLEHYDDITYEEIADFEEAEEAISAFENELYSGFATEELLEDVDLETIENLYK